jgi:hypothetical protein
MGDICDLVNITKSKFSTSKVILSDVLWRQDVLWWHIGAVTADMSG